MLMESFKDDMGAVAWDEPPDHEYPRCVRLFLIFHSLYTIGNTKNGPPVFFGSSNTENQRYPMVEYFGALGSGSMRVPGNIA